MVHPRTTWPLGLATGGWGQRRKSPLLRDPFLPPPLYIDRGRLGSRSIQEVPSCCFVLAARAPAGRSLPPRLFTREKESPGWKERGALSSSSSSSSPAFPPELRRLTSAVAPGNLPETPPPPPPLGDCHLLFLLRRLSLRLASSATNQRSRRDGEVETGRTNEKAAGRRK